MSDYEKVYDDLGKTFSQELKACSPGIEHRWRLTFWEQKIDEFAHFRDGNKIPIHQTVKVEMICICGLHVTMDRGMHL